MASSVSRTAIAIVSGRFLLRVDSRICNYPHASTLLSPFLILTPAKDVPALSLACPEDQCFPAPRLLAKHPYPRPSLLKWNPLLSHVFLPRLSALVGLDESFMIVGDATTVGI